MINKIFICSQFFTKFFCLTEVKSSAIVIEMMKDNKLNFENFETCYENNKSINSSISSGILKTDIDSNASLLDVEAIFVLEAQESRHFKVKFAPHEEGHYQSEFSLRLLNNPDVFFTIRAEGIAEIPRIKYLEETQILNFGNLLVLPDNIKFVS